jgi:raffinose synthase
LADDGWQQIGSENKEESANAVVQERAQYVTVGAVNLVVQW